MKSNFNKCLKSVLKEEGGFVNNPFDPGGATNHGVTKHVWEGWVGHSVSVEDMKELSEDDVKPLYKKKYWDVNRCDDLPGGVDLVVFDTSVHSGPTKAAKLLQQAVSTTVDGIIGPKTIQKVIAEDPLKIIKWYCDARLAYLKSLGTFPVFGKGWTARVVRLKEKAPKMVS